MFTLVPQATFVAGKDGLTPQSKHTETESARHPVRHTHTHTLQRRPPFLLLFLLLRAAAGRRRRRAGGCLKVETEAGELTFQALSVFSR